MSSPVRYLRMSLIKQCNLACSYCKPQGLEPIAEKKTPPETFCEAINLLHKIGIKKIRFTGGEPTLYKELPELVAFAKSRSNNMQVAVTSNGLLLNSLAKTLAESGLDKANISLDTLDRNKFSRITGSDSLDKVITGIESAIKYIPRVKLNCVVMAGINDMEAESMIRFADSLGIDIRFIEFMPTKHSGSNSGMYVSGHNLRASLPFELNPILPEHSAAARYYQSGKLGIRVGFIDPVSHSFCARCDRIRLASDGSLYGCLFSGKNFNLFKALNTGEENAILQVKDLIASKKYLGCSALNQNNDDLPSFLNMGG